MQAEPSLYLGVMQCTRCPLHELRGVETESGGRTQTAVPADPGFAYGLRGLAFLAQSPGEDEGLAGRPLIGRAGRCAQELALRAGIDWDATLKTNTVRCQPPNNRLQDYPDAVVQCATWTQQELLWYDPAVVVLMGNDAIRHIFGEKAKVTYTRGMVRATSDTHPWGARCYVATWHPSAVLRNGGPDSEMGAESVRDLRLAKGLLE